VSETDARIRNISDTAMWAAVYRARESERSDALFRDPYARRLAGARGEEIAVAMPFSEKATWAWVARTYLFDAFITEQIQQDVDTVVNLAAGLDARPYRMTLPNTLHWVEVDLAGILDYKEEILAGEKPVCALERVRLDLSDLDARRKLFERLGRDARKALIISEGLLIYLTRDDVSALAHDLSTPPAFQRWVVDIASPGLVKMLQKNIGQSLSEAGAPLKFGPFEGPEFFEPYGWKPIDVRNPLKTAARFKRLSFGMRLAAMLPASNRKQGSRPWSGICLLAKV
jgi:methyltransferase (TIGR00027 family)